MLASVTVRAPAKVNLALDVGPLREAQWKMREAIDRLREEQDFRDQLTTPSDKEQ